MKLLCLNIIMAAFFALSNTSSNPISSDGYYKGIRLAGKVQFVESGEDFRIQIVEHFPHLNVRYVKSAFMNNKVGEWQKVDRNPDFKVKVVNAWPDFRVRVVSAFPGVEH